MASVSFAFIAALWFVLMSLSAGNRRSTLTLVLGKALLPNQQILSLFQNIALWLPELPT